MPLGLRLLALCCILLVAGCAAFISAADSAVEAFVDGAGRQLLQLDARKQSMKEPDPNPWKDPSVFERIFYALNMTEPDPNEVVTWQPWTNPSERERMFQEVLAMEGDPHGRSIPIMGMGEMGVTAAMNSYVLSVMLAMKTNVPALACEGVENLRPFFVNRHNNMQNRSCPNTSPLVDGLRPSAPCLTMMKLNESHPSEPGVPSLFDQVGDMKRYLYHELFTPTQEFANHVLEAQQKMGLANERYIGVHIRHSDGSSQRRPVGFAQYADAVMKASKDTGITTLFVSSDDLQAKAQMQQLFEGFRVEEQPRLDASAYNGRYQYPEEAVRQLLTDMSLLIKADVFIGTATSDMGEWVYWQREPRQLSISLQSGWGFSMCGV